MKNKEDEKLADTFSALKIQSNEELGRVMARSYYGKWYVKPNAWDSMTKKGFTE